MFYLGECLRLELPCIWVSMVVTVVSKDYSAFIFMDKQSKVRHTSWTV